MWSAHGASSPAFHPTRQPQRCLGDVPLHGLDRKTVLASDFGVGLALDAVRKEEGASPLRQPADADTQALEALACQEGCLGTGRGVDENHVLDMISVPWLRLWRWVSMDRFSAARIRKASGWTTG